MKNFLPQEPDFLQSSSEVSCIFNIGSQLENSSVYALGLIWGLYVRMILPSEKLFLRDCREVACQFETIDITRVERVNDD